MSTTNIAQRLQLEKTWDEQLSITSMIILHLLPGALVMLLMIFASQLLEWFEIYPSVPVLFTFVAPALMLLQLGFLYHQGKRLNGKYSLQGIVLYRDHPMPW